MKEDVNISQEISAAVSMIRSAILQSQERAIKAVNQEQLALYYGIGRFISSNTRNKNWGAGVIEGISNRLRSEFPGIKGYSVSSLKNMRLFYEAWNELDVNSPIAIGELAADAQINRSKHFQSIDIEQNTIRQLRLANYPDFPIVVFLSISFTHHICIIENAKDLEELDLRRMKNGIGFAHNIEFLPLIYDKFHMVLPLICDKNTKMLA